MDVYLDQLFEFAGIAITLTGFSALISVIGTSKHYADEKVDMFRALLLVLCGLITVLAMLLPAVLGHFLTDDVAWRFAATIVLVATFLLCCWGFIWTRAHYKSLTLLDKYITSAVYVFSFALLGSLLLIVIGEAADSGAVYILAMFLATVVLGLFFTGIATSILLPRISDKQR